MGIPQALLDIYIHLWVINRIVIIISGGPLHLYNPGGPALYLPSDNQDNVIVRNCHNQTNENGDNPPHEPAKDRGGLPGVVIVHPPHDLAKEQGRVGLYLYPVGCT